MATESPTCTAATSSLPFTQLSVTIGSDDGDGPALPLKGAQHMENVSDQVEIGVAGSVML